ncbi:MAG: DUF4185 domain-containing protein [Candidatus Dadabacteria bacterium]|nr:MAG: DUF4185 domain-containing protein [Candidatus Dadabacteria bacterium]
MNKKISMTAIFCCCVFVFCYESACAEKLKLKVNSRGKSIKLSFGKRVATMGEIYEVYAARRKGQLKDLSTLTPIVRAASNPLSSGSPKLTIKLPKIKGKAKGSRRRSVVFYFRARVDDVKNDKVLTSAIKRKVVTLKQAKSGLKKSKLIEGLRDNTAPTDTKTSVFPKRMYGDIWQATVLTDGRYAFMFGDGTGRSDCLPSWDGTLPGEGPDPHPYTEVSSGCYQLKSDQFQSSDICHVYNCSKCYPVCDYTQTGFVILEGSLPNLQCKSDSCLVAKHVPYGDRSKSQTNRDKPSGLLGFPDGTIVAWMHYLPGDCERGYVVVSTDSGKSWTVVNESLVLAKNAAASPWDATSNYCVMTPIQYGPGYSQNSDGFVYLLSTPDEVSDPMNVYLARVPVASVTDYTKYEYFTGLDGSGNPGWSTNQSDGKALDNLTTMGPFGAVWNSERNEFNALSSTTDTNGTGIVWRADNPWGPWSVLKVFQMGGASGVIKADKHYIYFTTSAAAQAYMGHINRVRLD